MRGRPTSIREEDLLDAAREVFLTQGHSATTAAIAKQAGVAEGTLFRRYKSKDALLAAVIVRETEPPAELAQITATGARRAVRTNLLRFVEVLLGAVARAHLFIDLAETSPRSSEIRRLVMAQGTPPPQRIVELLAGYLDTEIAAGRVRRINTLAAARAVMGACIDFTRARQFAGEIEDAATFAAGLVDVLTKGMT